MRAEDLKFSRALVLGVTGFTGAHVARHLMDLGVHLDVARREDVATDDALRRLVAESDPDVIFNCAGSRALGRTRAEVGELWRANVHLTERIGRVAARAQTPWVHCGSRWQIGERGEGPNGPYAMSKTMGLHLALDACERSDSGLHCVLLRDSFGQADGRSGLMNLLLEGARSGREIRLTAGEQRFDPIYVDQVVEALVSAANLVTDGRDVRIWEIGREVPHSLRDVVAEFESVIGAKLRIQWGALPYRPEELFELVRVYDWLPGWDPMSVRESIQGWLYPEF